MSVTGTMRLRRLICNGENFISYDDEESIAWKIRYLKEKGLGGIMYWEYCCDGSHTLTEFMRKELDK